jgi:hypothetical protein
MLGGVISIWLATCLCSGTADSPAAAQAPAEAPPVTIVIQFGPESNPCAPASLGKSTILHRLDIRAARARDRLGTLTFQLHEQFDRCMECDVVQSIIMTVGVAGYFLQGWNPH